MLTPGQKVQIHYAGSLENGRDFINTWLQGSPVEVCVGDGTLLPLFEEALIGMNRSERKTVKIPMAHAYGAYDDSNVVTVPLSQIPHGEEMPLGSYVDVQTGVGKARVKVLAIENGTITFDCNHELAGHDLTFEIELVQDGTQTLIDREKESTGCGCGCGRLQDQLLGSHCACEH